MVLIIFIKLGVITFSSEKMISQSKCFTCFLDQIDLISCLMIDETCLITFLDVRFDVTTEEASESKFLRANIFL